MMIGVVVFVVNPLPDRVIFAILNVSQPVLLSVRRESFSSQSVVVPKSREFRDDARIRVPSVTFTVNGIESRLKPLLFVLESTMYPLRTPFICGLRNT